MIQNRRIDPEPITIYLAVLSSISGAIAMANYAKTSLKPLPTQLRAKINQSLSKVETEIRYLQIDIQLLREIFRDVRYSDGYTIRPGNGAFLSPNEFQRYEGVSDGIYSRLRLLNKLGLKLEKQCSNYSHLEVGDSTNLLGEAYSELERLLDVRNLSVVDAWDRLENFCMLVGRAIYDLRNQLTPY